MKKKLLWLVIVASILALLIEYEIKSGRLAANWWSLPIADKWTVLKAQMFGGSTNNPAFQ